MDPRSNPLSVDFLTSQQIRPGLKEFQTSYKMDKICEDIEDSLSSSGDSDLATSNLTNTSGADEVNSPRQAHKFAPLASQIKDEFGRVYEKPTTGYISIISKAILDSPDKKLLLCDLYDTIMETYPYFKYQKNQAWRNSVRHNLSLNECFVKSGRSVLGKGNYWSVHQACENDFKRGDFRRRRARRKSKRGSFQQIQYLPPSANASYPLACYGSSGMYSGISACTPISTIDGNFGLSYNQYSPFTAPKVSVLPLNKVPNEKMSQYENTTTGVSNSSTYTQMRDYSQSGATRINEKAPPPNINAAHMAQLGFTGAYNTTYNTPLSDTYMDAYTSSYGSNYANYGNYMPNYVYSGDTNYTNYFADALANLI